MKVKQKLKIYICKTLSNVITLDQTITDNINTTFGSIFLRNFC